MDYNQAIGFIALYGNCTQSIDELLRVQPTMQQLDNAIHYAIISGQPKGLAEEARAAIVEHYEKQWLRQAGIEDV